MEKGYRIVVFTWLIVISLISIIALVRSFYHDTTLGIDYSGIFVGILSALCTVLIGWQIFNLIDFSKREERNKENIDKLNVIQNNFHKHTLQTEYILHNALADIFADILEVPIRTHPAYDLVRYRIMSIIRASQLKDIKLCDSLITKLLDFISNNRTILIQTYEGSLIELLSTTENQSKLNNYLKLLIELSKLEVESKEFHENP